ncbi:MAG TPA: glycosyltransferase family 4 protein [Geminicoccaceae bacterium]|nr:glycosyltransferase family 4 protein [Geminicoccus sp.]HMU52472.1 glycosyltransferase family 4 protein [Geminicoccaceae bacterium]
MSGRRSLVFAISADYARATGGWIYNQRLLDGLASLGWLIERLTLPAGFPEPDAAARAETAALVRALPDGTLLLVDQLCISVLPDLAEEQGRRLRLAVIVHHPLALEGDLPEAAARRAAAERRTLAAATLVLATSQATAEALRWDYAVDPARLVVGPPGIDRHPAVALRDEGGPLPMLNVGAVVPRKDQGLLIEALAGLQDRAWELRIAGDLERSPAHLAGLREQVRKHGLDGRVSFLGALGGAAFEAEWRRARLFVASSRHEGFGMAVAEAVARGLPVVTTTAGAVEGWLDRRAAIMVPVGDVAALREALRRVLDEPGLRRALHDGAVAAAANLPSWQATAATVDSALSATADAARRLAS